MTLGYIPGVISRLGEVGEVVGVPVRPWAVHERILDISMPVLYLVLKREVRLRGRQSDLDKERS
jgi:hypothetical protein